MNGLAAFVLAGCLSAGPVGPAAPAPPPAWRLDAPAGRFEAAHGAVVGLSVVDLADGRILAARRAGERFLPASNQKLLTCAFALERLGAEFQFATGVFRLGEDLLVAGEGDPTLGDTRIAAERGRSVYAELDDWAAAVREHVGPAVRDIIVCVDPARPGRHPAWEPRHHSRWYGAPVGLLNFHDNCLDVTFARTGPGLVPVLAPASRFYRVVNRLRFGRPHLWSLRTEDDDATVVLTGKICEATDRPQSIPVERPALLLGRTFAERLCRAGVAVRGTVRPAAGWEIDWAAASVVARTFTPLFVVMRRACKKSLNLAAEAMFLRAGDGTWRGSAEMMARTLRRTYGLAEGSVRPADGSGLGRGNRVSPAAMTRLLAAVAYRPDGVLLLRSLPVAGVDGTLEDRFTTSPCRGRILAKTGYIRGVSTLSGYVLDARRRPRVAFSILVNGREGILTPAKRLQEQLCEMLLEALPPAPGGPGQSQRTSRASKTGPSAQTSR